MKKIDNIYNFISPRGRGLFGYLLLSLTLLTVACKKDKNEPQYQTDVYAIVSEYDSDRPYSLWKNGEVQYSLTDNGEAFSVYVSGSDVYVAGYVDNGTKKVATLWKNGVAQDLSDGTHSAIAYSVYVSGSDVYVAGYEYNGTRYVATLWKNGVAQGLSDGT